MGRLEGKVAIVTGGASGIGRATVERFAAEGARVLFTDIEAKSALEIEESTGATFMAQDVSSEEDWQKIGAEVLDRFGRLDILVNNAGVMASQNIEDCDLGAWNRLLAINLTGTMLGCRTAIELMKSNPAPRGGSIINLASTTSFMGLASDAAYTASKSGVVGLTRSIATHCAQQKLDIRCNTIHPGPTLTGIAGGIMATQPELREAMAAMAPMGRFAMPAEIANMAVYLASDDASYSTGAQFVVDGGTISAHP